MPAQPSQIALTNDGFALTPDSALQSENTGRIPEPTLEGMIITTKIHMVPHSPTGIITGLRYRGLHLRPLT